MIRDSAELSNDPKQCIIDLCCLKLSAEEMVLFHGAETKSRERFEISKWGRQFSMYCHSSKWVHLCYYICLGSTKWVSLL